MTAPRINEEEIFQVACDLASQEAHEAYLDQVRGEDWRLKKRVLTLLRADLHQRNLEDTAENSSDRNGVDAASKIMGPYKILQEIGMGVVYMAEQIEPVKRRVALKLVKPGLETNQVPLFNDLTCALKNHHLVNRGHLILGNEVAPRMDRWLEDVFEQRSSNDKAVSTPSADEVEPGEREPNK